MTYLEDTIDWQAVHFVDEWLDRAVAPAYRHQPLAQDWARVGKVIEELGESIGALIGYTGQNPRKGITHERDDLLNELADTALTAVFAIQHFTKNTATTRAIIRDKLAAIDARRAQHDRPAQPNSVTKP